MKTKITILICLLSQVAISQSIVKSSIDNGGESVSDQVIHMVYTIGEVNVMEIAAGDILLSEGFISPSLFSTSIIAPGVTVMLLNSYNQGLAGGTVKYYAGGWQAVEGETDSNGEIIVDLPEDINPTSWRMYYAGASEQKNNPVKPIVFQTVNVTMDLLSSTGENLSSEDAMYYASGWKTFGTGITSTSMELLPINYPFRVYYKGGSKQISQDVATDPDVVFETVNVSMDLLSSTGETLSSDDAKYYASGWKTFGTGVTPTSMELLPDDYPFRAYYKGGSNQLSQDVGTDPDVSFETVNVNMDLLSSTGETLSSDDTKYYASGWKTFSTGITPTSMELLPDDYPFRAYYKGGSNQKSQDVGTDPNVVFETVNVNMDLLSSTGEALSSDDAKYYASGWKTFGTGVTPTSMELLPNDYPFRAYFKGGSNQKSQDVGADPDVVFETGHISMELWSSTGEALVSDDAKYYAGGWKTFGSGNTPASMELLPNSYPFRVYYKGGSFQKSQSVENGSVVEFSTTEVTMTLEVDGSPRASTDAKYYASGWKTFGTGITPTSMELLPDNYPFRVYYDDTNIQQSQDVGVDPLVAFIVNGAIKKSASVVPENSIQVFPNPAENFLTIEVYGNQDERILLSIYSSTGKVLYVTQATGQLHEELDVSDYVPGLYMIRALVNDTLLTERIIIQ